MSARRAAVHAPAVADAQQRLGVVGEQGEERLMAARRDHRPDALARRVEPELDQVARGQIDQRLPPDLLRPRRPGDLGAVEVLDQRVAALPDEPMPLEEERDFVRGPHHQAAAHTEGE